MKRVASVATETLIGLAALGCLAAALLLYSAPDECPDGKCPAPAAPTPNPSPAPQPPPKPQPRPRCPSEDGVSRRVAGLATLVSRTAGAKVSGPVLDGVELSCDYPGERHRRNTASKGLGLCVFTSIHHAADWQDIPALLEMPKWMVSKGIAGGGYPGKVAKLIPQLCQERGLPTPDYIQVESNDLEVLKAACKAGRMPCVTYAYSPTGRYGGRKIAHMVNLVHMDDKFAVVLDNNYVGYNKFEWMTHSEFLKSYSGGSTGWSVIFLANGPPPPPHNGGPKPPPSPNDNPPPTPDDDEDRWEWKPWNGTSGRWLSLYDRGREVGLWDGQESTYHPRKPNSDAYAVAAEPPTLTPTARAGGVIWDRIAEAPKYRHGEYEVSRDDVLLALANVPDDARKNRVVAVGPRAELDRVRADWQSPEFAAHREHFVLQTYEPNHWHVKGFGFVLDGAPAIHITEPDGKLLAPVEKAYSRAGVLAQLRRIRPDNPLNPISPLGPARKSGRCLKLALVAGAVLLGLYLLLKRRDSE